MEIGLTIPFAEASRSEFLTWCRRIDEGPFSSLAFGERLAYPSYDLVTTLAAAAVATEGVRLIATVAVAPAHRTVALAKQAATIDVLSGGRLTLGVGVGGRREDFLLAEAPFDHRHQRLDEQVALMQRIWAGEAPFADTGPVGPAPAQTGGPPLLAGAMGPEALRRAARWADGVVGFDLGPDEESVRRAFERACRAWDEAGRSRPRLVTSAWIAPGPHGRVRLDTYVRRYLDFLGSDFADASASACRVDSEDALRVAIESVRAAGADELLLAPITADLGELERIVAVVSEASRRPA